ncbi:MAG: acetylornithine deacetylase, partial [Burkholderiales bacterium]
MDDVELLSRLVAFDTVSHRSNLALVDFLCEYSGAKAERVPSPDGTKANLVLRFGPDTGEGLVLCGHMDVVPAEEEGWRSDPFQLRAEGDRLFARGACDMKGFIACVLALVPEILERGLKTPLHLAFSYDEEVGCIGVGRLIADLRQAGIRPRSCIVGEPTEMRPVIAHKGKKGYRCTVRGLAGHSAYAPLGVNAVEFAAEAVAFLKQLARRHRDRGPYDRGFDIAHTTVHTGVIRGGSALNVIPHECAFDFEFRHLPGDDPDRLLGEFTDYVRTRLEPEMRAVHPAAGFTIEPLSEIPMLDTGPEAEVVALAQELAGSGEIAKVSFATEGSQFQRAGIPTVVCGPGSIAQAHKPNEYVTLDQIA